MKRLITGFIACWGVLLPLIAMALEPFCRDIIPTLRFTENYAESVYKHNGYWDVMVTNTISISGKVSLKDVDLASFNAATPYRLQFGDLLLSGTLGDDPAYAPGKTGALINIIGRDLLTGAPKKVGNFTFTWTSKALTFQVKILAQEDFFSPIAWYYAGDDDDEIEDELDVSFQFGDRILEDISAYYIGTAGGEGISNDYPVIKDGEEFYLARVRLDGTIDSSPPTLSYSWPAADEELFTKTIQVRGTADDKYSGIDTIFVRINGGEWVEAIGYENWALGGVVLQRGRNTIEAYALDAVGIASPIVRRYVYYSAKSPLTVTVSGQGTVSSLLSGTTYHKAGEQLAITAKPALGHIFTGWTGSITSPEPTLKFVMQPVMNLTAHFVPGPFVQLAGNYAASFLDRATGWTTGGLLTLSVNPAGVIAGKLNIAGKSYPVKGAFDPAGSFRQAWPSRRGPGPELSLTANLAAFDGTLAGNLLVRGVNLPLLLERGSWNEAGNPAPYAGTYTLVLPPEEPPAPNAPQGDGYGTVVVNEKGKARVNLFLPDGRRMKVVTFVSNQGHMPVGGRVEDAEAVVAGQWTFQDVPGVSDFDGTLTWLTAAGLATTLPVVGSAYVVPASATGLLGGATTAEVEHGGGALGTTVIEKIISIGDDGTAVVANPGADRLQMRFKLNKGLFSGSFIDGAGRQRNFGGAILQKQKKGGGCFPAKGTSGYSRVQARP